MYILATKKADLHISNAERESYSIKSLERDSTVAKVRVTVLDVNDNPPVFERGVSKGDYIYGIFFLVFFLYLKRKHTCLSVFYANKK